MRRFFLFPVITVLLAACSSGHSQWECGDSWYNNGRIINRNYADVFYLVSTNVLDAVDDNGVRHYTALLSDADKQAMDVELAYMDGVFGDSLNFFAPYYHQHTFSAIDLGPDDIEPIIDSVRAEVFGAFDYYITRLNPDRPFILAGFSQGGMLVRDLIKHMTDEQYSRMVVAYMLGYGLSEEDISHPHIIPADDADGWGEVVSFNSAVTPEAAWDFVSAGAATCINPLNWTTDSTPADLYFRGDTASVHVDTASHLLIVEDLDDGKYDFPLLERFFEKGNLHHWDIKFYCDAIAENAKHRVYGTNIGY